MEIISNILAIVGTVVFLYLWINILIVGFMDYDFVLGDVNIFKLFSKD